MHIITEFFSYKNIRDYTQKHQLFGDDNDKTAVKNWCRQILKGLAYLHTHDLPIIDGDVKGENIFINGNSGVVKIGDM